MHLCVVSGKRCWRDDGGQWFSSGGFPLQMAALAGLFERTTLLVVEVKPEQGGLPILSSIEVVPLAAPRGGDGLRKVWIMGGLPYYFGKMLRVCAAADVVHAPLPGDVALLGLWAGFVLGKRLLGRYGGSWECTSQTTWMNRVTRGCMRWLAKGRNVMLATGEGAQPPAPGMNWIFATALTRAELTAVGPVAAHEVSAPLRLVYLGRLSSEKGLHHLIEALGRLAAEGTNGVPHLTLAGEGPERRRLTALASSCVGESRVRFAGQLDRAGLGTLLRESDLCVQPSLTEGYSKAWLDAMAFGVPVVASRVGAAEQVIGTGGERGWLVSPGNVDELKETLRRCAVSPIDWPALRARCRAYAETRVLEEWRDRIGRLCREKWGWV